jgi:murein DD-endopeptidase MepM/ murein hydrolase activator NlpD
MGLKHHTILFVPHDRSRFRKLRISSLQLTLASIAVLTLMAAGATTSWILWKARSGSGDVARIQQENEQLRQARQEAESSLERLTQRVESFEQRTRRLAIVAGLSGASAAQSGAGGRETAPLLPRSSEDLENRVGRLGQQLDLVEETLSSRRSKISATPAIVPVRGVLTSNYGVRRDPITGAFANHLAIDIAAMPGRPVVAAADGLVTESGRVSGGLGIAVYLSHGYGRMTRYGHLSAVNVKPGQTVRRGEVIGFVGNTGRATGYHLHYEVLEDGKPVDPLAFILNAAPQDQAGRS